VKIYTKTGDEGETGLFGGGRVSKDHRRVHAYGDVDELNSVLGWALTQVTHQGIVERLGRLQHDLFAIGSELATPPPIEGRVRPETPGLPVGRVEEMEAWIDESDDETGPLRQFVLPGGAPGAAALHVARTVCRRVERSVVALAAVEPVDPAAIVYLNRLSDLLFSFARLENRHCGLEDIPWKKG
jgi:cob(I)alamin adenosyltransferase